MSDAKRERARDLCKFLQEELSFDDLANYRGLPNPDDEILKRGRNDDILDQPLCAS